MYRAPTTEPRKNNKFFIELNCSTGEKCSIENGRVARGNSTVCTIGIGDRVSDYGDADSMLLRNEFHSTEDEIFIFLMKWEKALARSI